MSKLQPKDVVFVVSMFVYIITAVFMLCFDYSEGWRKGWIKFKEGFISYGVPILTPMVAALVAAAVVYMLGLAVVKYFY
ncbi:hypothetical protein JNO12_10795 [Erwinia aphidicola]|nr:hypothetical protein [Erwinia aphidicola]